MTTLLRRTAPITAAAVCALSLAACSSDSGSGSGSGKPSVVVGFYPQEFLVERIGGDHVDITSLAQPGADPHESELSGQDIGKVSAADLVVYAAGFQPSLDDAIANESPDHVLDLADVEGGGHDGHDHGAAEGTDDHADDHTDGSAAPASDDHAEGDGHDGHDHTGDPHAWQDPVLMKEMAHQVAEQLAEIDPDNADAYETAAEDLETELTALDEEFHTGLAQCERKEFVTTHTAFGYLADAYGLTQMGISGLSTEQEPSAAKLAEVKAFVEEHGVTTIFYEDTVSPKYADTVAEATGASTDVLYPLESKPEVGDYIAGMQANLAALQKALGCA